MPRSQANVVLTNDMGRVIRKQGPGFAATVCPDGILSLSPKGTTAVWDDGHIVVAGIRSPQTVKNLRANPAIEVNVADPITRKGYRFYGRAALINRGPVRTDPGLASADLHAGIDVARASHDDYAGNVTRATRALPQPVSLCGWSMGGLVVLQASQQVRPHSVILLEPSPPAEVQGVNLAVEIKNGTFDPEKIYGPFPPGMRSRPESSPARAERKRGIPVPSVPCPSLVVYGDENREQGGTRIARLHNSRELHFPGISHWGPVRTPPVRAAIGRCLLPSPNPKPGVLGFSRQDGPACREPMSATSWRPFWTAGKALGLVRAWCPGAGGRR